MEHTAGHDIHDTMLFTKFGGTRGESMEVFRQWLKCTSCIQYNSSWIVAINLSYHVCYKSWIVVGNNVCIQNVLICCDVQLCNAIGSPFNPGKWLRHVFGERNMLSCSQRNLLPMEMWSSRSPTRSKENSIAKNVIFFCVFMDVWCCDKMLRAFYAHHSTQ